MRPVTSNDLASTRTRIYVSCSPHISVASSCRMMDLRDQLQTTLGSALTVEHELGGGGMSRVFVAEDAALGRKVVVKVLAPELTGAVNVERFKREIQLAARLQHPHVVPVLSAGD